MILSPVRDLGPHLMALNWQVELLRLTLISSEPVALAESDWTAITGEAEAATRQNVTGGKRYAGAFAGGQLTLAGVGQRVDLVLNWQQPPQLTEVPQQSLPSIGTWDQIRDRFTNATEKWLTAIKFPVIRLAFGAVLLSETGGLVQSYQVLQELLKSVAVDPERMRDFVFRVNWPTESSVSKGLRINQLTNWSPIQLQTLLLQLGDAQPNTASGPYAFAVRLEIDHNTDQENRMPFDSGVLVPIYKELIAKAVQNASSGERP